MSEQLAIFLLAGQDMPCRLVHALIWALDAIERGGTARIVLEGAAPQWLLVLPDPQHPQHGLYRRAKEKGLIDAICQACAVQAGAVAAAEAEGLRLVNDASGHVSLVPYAEAGYRIVTV
jgi:hypothetical protein